MPTITIENAGSNATINGDDGDDELPNDGATTRREVLFVDSKGQEIESLSGNEYTKEGIISYDDGGEACIVLTSTFRGTYTANKVANVDGSQTKKGIGIDASTAGSILIGGKGKDPLIGGENDFELTGVKGNDTLWGSSPDENYNDADIFLFHAGGGKITLANVAEQTYFNINDTTYHREGSHLAK